MEVFFIPPKVFTNCMTGGILFCFEMKISRNTGCRSLCRRTHFLLIAVLSLLRQTAWEYPLFTVRNLTSFVIHVVMIPVD